MASAVSVPRVASWAWCDDTCYNTECQDSDLDSVRETLSTFGRSTGMTQPSREFLDLQAALAGEYSLQRELGRGGMGIVYLARDVQLDRDVAIKVLPSHLARNAASRERFLREARTAAGLSHPNIVPIFSVRERGE